MRTALIQSASDQQTQYFTTGDGCRIAWQLDGPEDKPVLVLSNSIATDFHMWDQQIPVLTKYFRVLRFDTRGNGASGAPQGDYSIDRMGMDLLELLDTLHIDRVHFCGLSMGGFIGQWLGVHAPERIDKLILANTSPYLGPSGSWNGMIKNLRNGAVMGPFGDMFIHNWFPESYGQKYPAVINKFRAMVLATTPQGLAGSYAAIRDADFRRSNALITSKTLVIGGKYDAVCLPDHSEIIAKTIPHARLVLLPVVHLANVESPQEFEMIILDFLGTS